MQSPSWLARIDRALERTIYGASALLIVALSAVIVYTVCMRYFFNRAPMWSEELPRIIFLWASYLGIAVAVSRGQGLRVMVFIEKFRPLPRFALELFMQGAVFVMLGFLVWHNMPILELTAQTNMLATGAPDSLRHWPLSVGCVLMALYQIRQVIHAIDEYRQGYPRKG
jgi:TRAP-type transport system small permease protein